MSTQNFVTKTAIKTQHSADAPAPRTFHIQVDNGQDYVAARDFAYPTWDAAVDKAMELWVESGNEKFLGLPVFRVVDSNGSVCADPIDCFPYEV